MRASRSIALLVCLASVVGAVVAGWVYQAAQASRNATGTYSLTAGQPVVSGSTISSTTFNALTADLASEMTDSLSRSGKGAMLAPLQLSNGTVALPSLTFGSDTNTGLYRIGADNPAMTAGGVKVQAWSATTSTFTGASAGAGVTTTGGATGNGVTANGGATSGTGVHGTGGATSGTGVIGVGGTTNGVGVGGTGAGSGAGVSGTGGTTGVGGLFAAGTAATGGTPAYGVILSNGYVGFSGVTAPTSTTSIIDSITPANVIKATANFTLNSSASPTVSSGFNLTSVGAGGTSGTITFAQDFATSAYSCVATASDNAGTSGRFVELGTYAAGSIAYTLWDTVSGRLNPSTTTGPVISVLCTGAQ